MYNEVLKYESILSQLGIFIETGPYKLEYIIEKLHISRATFYNKRKTKNFSLDEVKILAKLYDDVDMSTRFQKQIERGLKDIKNEKVHDFDKVLAETREKYGL